MNLKTEPQAGSYESTLTEEQRTEFRALLLSGVTLRHAQEKALPWATGPDIGKKPSIACLGKIRVRLGLEDRVARLEAVAVTRRATRALLRRLVKGTDQEQVLDEAMALIGEQVIDACLGLEGTSSSGATAWLLLRRADQRRFDQRTAIFQAQAGKKKKTESESDEDAGLPPMDDEEKERRYRQIFGMEPI